MEPRDLISELVQAGMTQAQIAGATGIAQPTVSKIARGEVRDVLSTTYRRLVALHAERIQPAGPAVVPGVLSDLEVLASAQGPNHAA